MAKVVPESCQRTDGIDAWLEIKTEKENKRMEKEVKQRDRKEIKNYFEFIQLPFAFFCCCSVQPQTTSNLKIVLNLESNQRFC